MNISEAELPAGASAEALESYPMAPTRNGPTVTCSGSPPQLRRRDSRRSLMARLGRRRNQVWQGIGVTRSRIADSTSVERANMSGVEPRAATKEWFDLHQLQKELAASLESSSAAFSSATPLSARVTPTQSQDLQGENANGRKRSSSQTTKSSTGPAALESPHPVCAARQQPIARVVIPGTTLSGPESLQHRMQRMWDSLVRAKSSSADTTPRRIANTPAPAEESARAEAVTRGLESSLDGALCTVSSEQRLPSGPTAERDSPQLRHGYSRPRLQPHRDQVLFTPSRSLVPPAKIGFSFCPAGLLLPYHLGVAACLQQFGYINNSVPLAGASAGALTVALIACQVSVHKSMNSLYRVEHNLKKFGAARRLHTVLADELDQLLPDDAFERFNKRPTPATVAYTQVWPLPKGRFVHKFKDTSDLKDCLIASCNIPFYFSRWPTVTCRGYPSVDGYFASPRRHFGCPKTEAARNVFVLPFSARTVRVSIPREDCINPDLQDSDEYLSLQTNGKFASSLLEYLRNSPVPFEDPDLGVVADEGPPLGALQAYRIQRETRRSSEPMKKQSVDRVMPVGTAAPLQTEGVEELFASLSPREVLETDPAGTLSAVLGSNSYSDELEDDGGSRNETAITSMVGKLSRMWGISDESVLEPPPSKLWSTTQFSTSVRSSGLESTPPRRSDSRGMVSTSGLPVARVRLATIHWPGRSSREERQLQRLVQAEQVGAPPRTSSTFVESPSLDMARHPPRGDQQAGARQHELADQAAEPRCRRLHEASANPSGCNADDDMPGAECCSSSASGPATSISVASSGAPASAAARKAHGDMDPVEPPERPPSSEKPRPQRFARLQRRRYWKINSTSLVPAASREFSKSKSTPGWTAAANSTNDTAATSEPDSSLQVPRSKHSIQELLKIALDASDLAVVRHLYDLGRADAFRWLTLEQLRIQQFW